jgi:predicted RNA-binding Zn-ribbon protein involved in translation (DUF1610 family)
MNRPPKPPRPDDAAGHDAGRSVTCPDCGFTGLLEPPEVGSLWADDQFELHGQDVIFRLQGQDDKGEMVLRCPKCGADNSFGLSKGVLVRMGTLVLTGAVMAGIMFLIRKYLFG